MLWSSSLSSDSRDGSSSPLDVVGAGLASVVVGGMSPVRSSCVLETTALDSLAEKDGCGEVDDILIFWLGVRCGERFVEVFLKVYIEPAEEGGIEEVKKVILEHCVAQGRSPYGDLHR